MTATVALNNPKHYVTGALSTFVYTLSGSAVYELSSYVPVAYEVIGIVANFAAATNLGADNSIVVSIADETVSVYAGTSPETDAFTLSAVVFAKKGGPVA